MEKKGCCRREDHLLELPVMILMFFTPPLSAGYGGVVVSLGGGLTPAGTA